MPTPTPLRLALLHSVSLTALLVAPPARARSLSQALAAANHAAQTAVSPAAGITASAQAALGAQNFARATAHYASLSAALMTAARAGASPIVVDSVKDGYGPNAGLQAAPGAVSGNALWQGALTPDDPANAGGIVTSPSGVSVTVKQTAPVARLSWQSFNVGARTTLNFDQSQGGTLASSWVAINTVADPSANPAQILGAIRAQGKVYVLDGNGIAFSAGSTVDVGSLIAATSNIAATQFSTDAAGQVSFNLYGAQMTGMPVNGITPYYLPTFVNGTASPITVDAGASIETAAPTGTNAGGYVMLLGGNVANAGLIATPQGQTVLAAGTAFTLRQGFSGSVTSGNIISTTLGSEVAASNTGTNGVFTTGSVVNAGTGLVVADQGDISLVGHALTQAGVLLATTSVNTRGTVHFLTPTDGSDPTASITLAPNSVTEVEPLENGQTELDSARAANVANSVIANTARAGSASLGNSNPQLNNHDLLPDQLGESRVEISTYGTVEVGAGALVQAQGGQIAVNGGSQVTLDSGATLDVSGTTSALLPASINTLLVNVQPFQLSESAANRTGGLKGSNVYVDARTLVEIATGAYAGNIYTPGGLLQVGGFLGQVPHGIGELTAIGGQVTLQSRTSVSAKGVVTTSFGTIVTDPGSVINLQGGAVNYAAGEVPQSYVETTDGVIYNVNTAPASLAYAGLYTGFTVNHPRWHVTNVWDDPLLTPATLTDPGYTVGRDAGTLSLTGATEQIAGSIYAGITLGQNQIGPRPAGVTDPFLLAQTVVPQSGTLLAGNYLTGILQLSPIASTVSIAPVAAGAMPVQGSIVLDPGVLNAAALGDVTLSTGGDVLVAAPLTIADGGTLSLTGANIAIDASLTARSGAITLTDQLGSAPVGTVTSVTLAPGVVLDARGVFTNAQLDPTHQAGLGHANGGTVSIVTAGGVDLAPGTRIDVSSGGGYLASGAQQPGSGGSATVEADAVLISGAPRTVPVTLDASFVGYGTNGGGTLTVSAPDFEIGTAGLNSTVGTVVNLGGAFFSTGFSSYVVNGAQALNVLPGAQVTVAEPIYVANGLLSVPSGGDPSQAYTVTLPALYTPVRGSDVLAQRGDGASVSLLSLVNPGNAAILGGGTVTIGAGASVAVDPKQSIAVAGFDQVSVFGTLTAHAGTVTVGNTRVDSYTPTPPGVANLTASNFLAGVSDWIGAGSLLDVSGQATVQLDPFGRRFGLVTSGGTIALGGYNPLNTAQSTWAQVIVRPGATLDADGASAKVDVVPDAVQPGRIVVQSHPVTLAGAGGLIAARSLSGVALDGTLLAHAGDGQVAGGSLILQIDPITLTPFNNIPTAAFQPREVLVSNDAVMVQPTVAQPGDTPPPATYGLARISQQQIDAAGFDAVTLGSIGGAVIFDGDVSLHTARSLTFGTGIIGETSPYGVVQIASPRVTFAGYNSSIDSQTRDLQPAEATLASFSTLVVSADLIDIGAIIDLGGSIQVNKDAQLFAGPMTGGFGAPTQPIFTSGFGFTNAALSSTGDIRLLGTTDSNFNNVGTLTSIGDYSFTAAQLYPATGQSEILLAGFNTEATSPPTLGHTITVQGLGGAAPQGPYSVGGTLTLLSDTIVQDGVLRAPEGMITLSDGTVGLGGLSEPSQVTLGPDSITSVSLAGQSIPYGGTVDGVTYQIPGGGPPVAFQPAVVVQSQSLDVQGGAKIDISGGGTLTGQGFVFGRGGTADVLTTPLLDITGGVAVANALAQVTAIQPLRTGDPVYAILPGYQSAYAPPVTAGDSAYTVNQVGEQVTVGAGVVPGLAAGTYTLLPAYYALQQGGYRVELTTAPQAAGTSLYAGNFTTAAAVTLSVAGTSISSPTPVGALFTSGTGVRQLSQFDEENYSTFEVAQAALNGTPRPFLPQDAKTLELLFPSVAGTNTALSIAPDNLLQAPDAGGYGATLEIGELTERVGKITAPSSLLLAPGDTMTPGVVTIDAAMLSALDVPRLVVGGTLSLIAPSNTVTIIADTGFVEVLPYVTLSAGDIILTALPSTGAANTGAIIVSPKATLTTIGAGPAAFDLTQGYYFNVDPSTANPALDVSAGRDIFLPDTAGNSGAFITVGDQAALLANGSLNIVAPSGTQVNIGSATLGAAYASIAVSTINIGTNAALEKLGASLPPGLTFTPDTLSTLLNGNAMAGVPAAQQLALTATSQVNIVGSVQLNTGTTDLVLNTPAIYGVGVGTDVATISAAAFTWSGVDAGGVSTLPGGPIAQPMAGQTSGTLAVLTTGAITLGYGPQTQPDAQTQLDRLVTGFSNVVLQSATEITANNKSSLSVYQTQPVFGAPGLGGTLSLLAPLVTTDSAAVLKLAAGDAVAMSIPSGLAPSSTASVTTLGGEIDIAAPTLSLATAVALPSGRLSLTTAGDLSFLPGSVADLSGRAVHLLDQTVFSPGGTLVAESTAGNIKVAGLADVSSPGAAAGNLSYSALAGDLNLDGTLRGAAIAGQTAGSITLLAGTLSTTTSGSADSVFGLINAGLNAGGLFGSRTFEIGQLATGPGAAATPNVTIGNAADGTPLLVAHDISVTADQGMIDVTGTVEASGTGPGSIALQAALDLVLDTANGAPVLDAHATSTAVDSYGQPIDAENRAHVTLTSTGGSLKLEGGTIDLSYLNAGQPGAPVGELVLNAPRIGAVAATSGDVAIDASAPLNILGAASVALYGWTHYAATDAIGSIAESTQVDPTASVTLAAINADAANFINNAGTNASLTARLAGLIGSNPGTFHLRPGVEIDSTMQSGGDLTIVSDLDLAAGRYSDVGYGLQQTGVLGSGEPGSVVFRASNNLVINGSVTDGFGAPPDIKDPIPADRGWTFGGPDRFDPLSADVILPSTIVAKIKGGGTTNTVGLAKGSTFKNGGRNISLNYEITIKANSITNGAIPFPATLAADIVIPAGGFVTTSAITTATGVIPAGTLLAANTTIAAGSSFLAGATFPSTAYLTNNTMVPAGTLLSLFDNNITLSQTAVLPVNAFIPSNTYAKFVTATGAELKNLELRPEAYHLSGNKAQGYLYALAPMLPAGSLSWDLDFVAGANTNSADVNAVQSRSALAAEPQTQPVNTAFEGHGNLILDDQHYFNPPGAGGPVTPAFSVIRTGTGNLSLVAGGNFDQSSLYGIYTAGTQTDPGAGFSLPRAGTKGGELVKGGKDAAYNKIFTKDYQAYYPTNGGDVLVAAQGSVTGDEYGGNFIAGTNLLLPSDAVGNWLWRQGSNQLGQASAWWINFGSVALPFNAEDNGYLNLNTGGSPEQLVQLVGFQGIGALGGGNVVVSAGLDAGQTTDRTDTGAYFGNSTRGEGLIIAVGSTGRVLPNGTILETGGGDISLQVGGTINPLNAVAFGVANASSTLNGAITDPRGNITVNAGAVGRIESAYTTATASDGPFTPSYTSDDSISNGGLEVNPGDGAVTISARRDVVLDGVGDPGRVTEQNLPLADVSQGGTVTKTGVVSGFSLWTADTSINLFSSGGNVTPTTQPSTVTTDNASIANDVATDYHFVYPTKLTVTAATGDIVYGTASGGTGYFGTSLEIAPSANEQVIFLAGQSIFASNLAVDLSGASPTGLSTPFDPAFASFALAALGGPLVTNVIAGSGTSQSPLSIFARAFDTPTTTYLSTAAQASPALFYAGSDIVNFTSGETEFFSPAAQEALPQWYLAAKPVRIEAGRDIVDSGTRRPSGAPGNLQQNVFTVPFSGYEVSGNLFLNDEANSVSIVSAGRDILNSYFYVGGPGLLEVDAGRNITDTGGTGSIKSLGSLLAGAPISLTGGAGIEVAAGLGTGADYTAFADLYLNPANQANLALQITDRTNMGKVQETYGSQLLLWLQQNYGYTGDQAGALAYFLNAANVPSANQDAFLRGVFYNELLASGQQYNDAASRFFGSYVRGRQAIDTLLPGNAGQTSTNGEPAGYAGAITMTSAAQTITINNSPVTFTLDAGVATEHGGDIQVLDPGGQVILGTSGSTNPGAGTGLITNGSGNIDVFSNGSVLLGKSRIFTNAGGNIQIWSATGDINAGVGARTDVTFTPPVLVYDDTGGIVDSPAVPTTGAGISTQQPLPDIPPGNIDLTAPIGTIDAGEAGVRSSGNVNLAAAVIANAAGITAGGKTTGIVSAPTISASVAAAAGAAAGAATNAAQDISRPRSTAPEASVIEVEVSIAPESQEEKRMRHHL